MNGLDEFAESGRGDLRDHLRIIDASTRLESARYHEPVSKPPTTDGGQPEGSTATAREVQEDSQ
jgi:hypothetical protein